jgi:hypothetical protein
MACTSSRRHKGCQLCKPWKHAGHGDSYRIPASALRKMGGRTRRVSRRQVSADD